MLLAATSALVVRRPNLMRVQVGSDVGNFALWFDGAQATLFNPDPNLYGSTPLAGDVLVAADWLRDRMGLALPSGRCSPPIPTPRSCRLGRPAAAASA